MYLHISYIFSFVPLTKRWKKFMKSYSFIILSNIYLFVVRVWHIDLSHSVVHILKILVTYSGPTPFLLYIYVFACVTRRIYTIFCAYICNHASFCGRSIMLYRVLSNDTVMIHANLSVALLLGQLVLVTSDGAAKYMV